MTYIIPFQLSHLRSINVTDITQESCASPFDNEKLDRMLGWIDRPTLFGIRISALVETTMFLSAIVLLSTLFGDGTRYINAPLHPFWIIVLLITVQYGLRESVATAALASMFLLVGNIPEQSVSEGVYQYFLRVFSQPLLWLSVSLILGGIRQRQLGEKAELTDEFKKLEESVAVIVDGYKELKFAKDVLEMRLAEERCSLLSVYEIASELDTFDAAKATVGVEKLIRSALNPAQFSIFILDNGTLRLHSSFGWNDSVYAVEFPADHRLTKSIVGGKHFLNVVRPDDEHILQGQGLMAGPIYDDRTGRVLGMLKIEDADFPSLNLRTRQTFEVVCSWIGRTAANLKKYEDLVENGQERDSRLDTNVIPIAGLHAEISSFESNQNAA